MKFIHAADIHLDSPLTGLSAYADAPVEMLRTAIRDAFNNLVTEAIEQSVDFNLSDQIETNRSNVHIAANSATSMMHTPNRKKRFIYYAKGLVCTANFQVPWLCWWRVAQDFCLNE